MGERSFAGHGICYRQIDGKLHRRWIRRLTLLSSGVSIQLYMTGLAITNGGSGGLRRLGRRSKSSSIYTGAHPICEVTFLLLLYTVGIFFGRLRHGPAVHRANCEQIFLWRKQGKERCEEELYGGERYDIKLRLKLNISGRVADYLEVICYGSWEKKAVHQLHHN